MYCYHFQNDARRSRIRGNNGRKDLRSERSHLMVGVMLSYKGKMGTGSRLRARLIKLGTRIDCSGQASSKPECIGIRMEARSQIVMRYAIELIRLEMRVEPIEISVGDEFGTCWALYHCLDRNSESVKSLCPLHR
jgi:hypothetical protein